MASLSPNSMLKYAIRSFFNRKPFAENQVDSARCSLRSLETRESSVLNSPSCVSSSNRRRPTFCRTAQGLRVWSHIAASIFRQRASPLWLHVQRKSSARAVSSSRFGGRLGGSVRIIVAACCSGENLWRPVLSTAHAPAPVSNLRHVLAMLADVLPVHDALVRHRLLHVRLARSESRHAVDHVLDEMKTIHVVSHDHIEGGRGGPLLLEAANVDVAVIRSPVGQAVDEPRVAVVGEDDGTVRREN